MLRALVVAALLALAAPAAASPPTASHAGDLTLQPPGAGIELGNPLLRLDPAFWMPILREEGYAGAARAADQPEASSSSSEDEDQVEHWFMPLGDANGNGRDDVVLATAEDERVTLQALDGGRIGQVLWTLELPEDQYAYVMGDVDEDGVYDLEHLVDDESSTGEDGMEWEQRANVNVLSGRDLAVLTSLQVVSSNSYEETNPEPIPIGESTYRERFTFEFVMDADGLPGLARMAYNFEYYRSQDRIVVITTNSQSSLNSSMSFALLDAAGALVWAFDEPGWDVGYGFLDVTGDGVPDILVRTNDEFDSSSGGFGPSIDPPVDPPVPIPFLTQEEAPRPPYQVKLLDGANGALVWEREFGNASFSFTQWLGDLYGNGEVLAVSIYDFDYDDFEYSERMSFLDGDTGETLAEFGTVTSYAPLGDANHDGRDDLLAFDFNDSTLSFDAKDGDLNELWSASIKDDDYAGALDMTGDDVLDLLKWHGDNLTVVSGTNGKDVWTREESRMADLDIAPGIVDEDDRELALLLSDAKDHEDLADYAADLLVLRGADGAPLWRKPLYDPTDYTDVAGDDAFLWMTPAGDLNGDGANDFIVDFEQGYVITISTSCVNGECETERTDSRDDDEGQPMNIVALVDGASGATIARYDDMELSGKVKKVQEAPVDVKPAAEELVEEDVPGFAAFAAIAAIGLAFAMRRRKA